MLGLVRLAALRELRGGWRLLLVASAVLIFASALTALPLVYRATSADLALRELIAQSPDAVHFADHTRASRPVIRNDITAVDQAARQARDQHLAQFGGLVGETRRMSETPQTPVRWTRTDNQIFEALPAYFQTAEQLREHARLVEGRWPPQNADEVDFDAPIPTVIGAKLAGEIGLSVGSVVGWFGWEDEEEEEWIFPLQSEVVGIIEPLADDLLAFHGTDVWFELQANVGLAGEELPYFAVFIEEDVLVRALVRDRGIPGVTLTHRLRTQLHPTVLTSDDVDAAVESLAAYVQQLSRLEGGSAAALLQRVLETYQRRASFSGGQSLIAGLQLVAVALFAVALVGRRVAARTAVDRERLAARGARAWQQAAAQAMLGLWIAAPAAALGAPLAAFALHYAGLLGAIARVSGGELLDTRLTGEAWLLAVGGAIAAWLAFAAPAWLEARRRVDLRERGRPQRQSLIQRAWLDVALLILAAVLFLQFRSQATGGALAAFEGGGINPVLMLSPGLLLLGAALVLIRIAPRLLNQLARALGRTRAPTWSLLALQTAARRPAAAMSMIALVAFITAVGLISATYAATIRDTEEQRIRYTVGSQLRGVSIGSNLANSSAARVTEPLDSRSGVEAASAAYRGIGNIGGDQTGSRVILLGVQTDRLDDLVQLDDDQLGMPAAELLAAIAREPGRPGQPLPEDAAALRVWARTEPDNTNLELFARVLDRHGRVTERKFTTEQNGGVGGGAGNDLSGEWRELRASLESSVSRPLEGPLRLAAIILRPAARVVRAPTGSIWLDDLRAETPNGEAAVEPFERDAPWRSAIGVAGGDRIEFTSGGARQGAAALRYAWSGLGANDELLIVRESPNLPVRAAIDRESLEEAGLALGDIAPIVVGGAAIPVRIGAVVDYFPTLNPAQGGFVVADLAALRAAALVAASRAVLPVTEVWAAAAGDSVRAVVGQLLDDVYLSSVVLDAQLLLDDARSDPFRSGGIAALFVVGFLGLLLMGATTLFLTLAAEGRERAREFALLQTIGYGHAALRLQAAVEVLLVLLIGVAAGIGLGRAVAGALLGFLEVTAEGVRAAPPMTVSIDWLVASLGVAALALCALAGVGLVARWVAARDAAAMLREWED